MRGEPVGDLESEGRRGGADVGHDLHESPALFVVRRDQSSQILAYRNTDVRQLNDRIREVRHAAGELSPGVRVGGHEFAPGDRVLFLRNDHTGRQVRTLRGQGQGVKNGVLGTLLEADARRLRVRLEALASFRAARKAAKPHATLFSLARDVSAIYHTTPRRLIRRLAPREIKLLVSAVSFAGAMARKLMPEASEREQPRRRLLP